MAELSRRQFLKVTGASLAGSSLALIGFSPTAALAEVREFKLARATETRNTCPYCSVSCGVLMYSLGDNAKNAKASIFHIEGDPDHALDRIAKLMKADRDANFIEKNADGLTVNRWLSTGMLAASASSNEVGYLTHKVMRSFGVLAFDNQARV